MHRSICEAGLVARRRVGIAQYWVMPVLVLAAGNLGYFSRLTRANARLFGQDYVRTARGKGLPNQMVRTTHVLRNAMLPIVTVIGPAIAFLVTGVFVVESLFRFRCRVSFGAGG